MNSGPFAWLEREALDERSTIDLAFVGPSLMWAGIDTPLVQDALSRAEGKPAIVRTLASNWRGEDLTYTFLRDLLAHRRVKNVVLSLPANPGDRRDEPHPMAYRFLALGHGSEGMSGLSFQSQAQLVGDFVLGAPRHLLSLIRANPREDPRSDVAKLGGSLRRAGYNGGAFVPDDRDAEPVSPEELIYSPSRPGWFRFTDVPLSDYESHFVRLLLELLQTNGVNVMFLHIPMYSERAVEKVDELRPWPSEHGVGHLVGVAPARLFRGLPDADIQNFYYNEHLNANGARRFTRAILPALLTLYVDHTPS